MKLIVVKAIASDNLKLIKFLHTRGLMDLKNYREMSGETFLHTAVAYKSDKVLKYLIDEVKIPLDVANSVGETYRVSGRKAYHQKIREVIASGRRVGIKDGSPLQFSHGGENNIPRFSINFFEILEECKENGVDFNKPMNNEGQTVLHIVVGRILDFSLELEYGTINMLIGNGAALQIPDNKGLTPLKMVQNALSDTNQETLSRAQILIKEMTYPYPPPSYTLNLGNVNKKGVRIAAGKE